VTLSKDLGIAVAGMAAVTLAGVWAWRTVRRWRRKSPEEIERLRRLGVNACGRIILGRIVELAEPVADGPAGPILLYDYEVAGVTYEAAQDLSALPEIAAAAHRAIREQVHEKFGKEAADSIRILYGGSVKPDNARSLMAQPEIDGVLVGGASLDPVGFSAIVNF